MHKSLVITTWGWCINSSSDMQYIGYDSPCPADLLHNHPKRKVLRWIGVPFVCTWTWSDNQTESPPLLRVPTLWCRSSQPQFFSTSLYLVQSLPNHNWHHTPRPGGLLLYYSSFLFVWTAWTEWTGCVDSICSDPLYFLNMPVNGRPHRSARIPVLSLHHCWLRSSAPFSRIRPIS